ncbi:MAG TPA: tetratricopeptide repeat protein, partial [Pyrinomonadaceae bacterium]|nr:tetratricopeptide repeat protein [Pyrinomonadaceae bacterium]
CLAVIQSAGAFGLSRLLGRSAQAKPNLAVAEKVVELTPADAQAHFVRAGVLSTLNRIPESATELEHAVGLRPTDYSLWSQLGLLRDQLGDTRGALAAFDEAVKRAPYYARPYWQRGNVLLRAGQYEEAFKDLGQAAQSDPELMPKLINLAWALSKGNANLTEQWAQIKTNSARITFVTFLANQGRNSEAIAHFRAVEAFPEDLRRQLVEQLIAKSGFAEAFEVWRSTQDPNPSATDAVTLLYDGEFEAALKFDQGGFGWRVPRNSQGITFSLDASQPNIGRKNLRIDFGGPSNPGQDLVSQLLLVKPSEKYQVNFASRSQDVVTGGRPLMVVTDAQGDRKRLGQSIPLGDTGTSGWKVVSFEFSTGPDTKAVVLSLQRESCSRSPCPIFGSLFLDSVSVVQVN